DQPNNEGWTPLMRAAKGGHQETLRILLQNGADVHLRNKEGKTALDYAKDGDIRRMLQQTAVEAKSGGDR
ncbi:MAG: ankyrin repeat domain-containing protein, partial [Desulfobacteraceae bacterium]